ncbi:MAG: S9 family peptidase [Solobacterium sp.]|nr:S9 family peptidase [Solobacterium sp.]
MVKKLNPIELEDITKYRFPGNLQYSPDGKYLAFHVARADVKKNDYRRDVYLVKDGHAEQVTHSIDAQVLFFDDDTTLVLSRKNEEALPLSTPLYRLDVTGGEAQPWMNLPFPLAKLKKVKDNLYVAIGIIDANDPDAYKDNEETRKKKLEELKKEEDYHVVDEIPYWFNGVGYINKRRNALFVVDTSKGLEVKRLTAPLFDVDGFDIEGNKVYYTGDIRKNNPKMYSKLFVYNVNTKKTDTIYGKLDHRLGEVFVLNGQTYIHASDMKKYGINQTADLHKVTKNKLEKKYTPSVGLHNSVGTDTMLGGGQTTYCDGKYYYTLATVKDHTELYRFDSSMKKKVLFNKQGVVPFFAVSKNKIALCYQDYNHVAEIYEMDINGNNLKKLTTLNEEMLKGRYIAKPNPIRYTSEGETLKGWVLLPQDFNPRKKYPAVLDIHGGPRTVYGETFFHEMQLWAAKGFVVFFTNIRGSDGRGDKFADIRGKYGTVDFKNLMDFTDAVLAKYPNIDKKRICETGGSYGGFMSNWIIGHTNRFCCVASQRSISNWTSFTFMADIGSYFGSDQCGAKSPFDNEALWDRSPLKYANQVKTPTLFIHSDEDFRCPLAEGMQMMQALAYRNVETRLVVFKGENHELSRGGKPVHRLRRLQEITDWFLKHTKK